MTETSEKNDIINESTTTTDTTVSQVQEFINISNTAIDEYLEIVRSEYEIERNKKQSFESRAGIILALLGAICIFLFEKVQLKEIFILIPEPMTFAIFIQIISGITVYVGFLFTMSMIIRTITVKQHDNFEVKRIDEELLREPRVVALPRLIFTYRDIIVQHREINEKRAKAFKKSLIGIAITLVSVIVYITLT